MVNGLQIVTTLPFFNVKSPGNVNSFNKFIADLASFDFIDMNFITVAFFYFPETEPTSVQFENGGIESHFMILELKLLFYMFCIHLFLVIVHAILAIFKRCLPARL